jgi:uncharacterized membrane protein
MILSLQMEYLAYFLEDTMTSIKFIFQLLLSLLMIAAGVTHFIKPGPFVRIVPNFLPYPLQLVYISGFFEILGGIGLLIPSVSRPSAWGLIALFIAVFPANINMAINHISFGEGPTPDWALWLRLPLQLVLIAWAYWFTR